MLLLLPPSEGKTRAPAGARPVDLGALSRPGLTEKRLQVLDALVGASARPDAADLLGVGASLEEEVRRNVRLRDEPATDMARVYSGVLFSALGLGDLPATGRRRARAHVVVVSALWGALSPGDRVPAYRLSMGTDLPGTGPLAAHWREVLGEVLGGEVDGLVVDCRSAAYVAAYRPRGDAAEVTVQVRVLSGGAVVSHHAKHTRGLLARHLLLRPARVPRSPQALADAAGEQLDVDLQRSGAGWRLDVHTA
ncbi:YaaA family protein [Aquipuribacter sp. MA13-6]|uniref:YaaA family protein n=1 Tax=unclassified Aquipuribacter TaxID=2635084 RepID=UPI003EED3173